MKRIWQRFVPVVIIALFVTSCGADTSSGSQGSGSSYKDMKTMVMDILKSEDGKKAIKAAQSGGGGAGGGEGGGGGSQANESKIKLLSANDSLALQMAVKDVLTAQENSKFLQDMMTDPKFAGDFAKAIQSQTKQMHKELLKDPEYQKSLIDAMKNPEYERIIINTMKTAQYRQQMMTVIQESMKSPLFRADLVELLKAAIEQQSQPGQTTKAASDSGQNGEEGKKKEKEKGKKKKQGEEESSDEETESGGSGGDGDSGGGGS